MSKKISRVIAILSLCVMGVNPIYAHDIQTNMVEHTITQEQDTTTKLTVADYEEYLIEQCELDNSNYESLEQFRSLTEEEKEVFMSYINDPYLVINMMDAASNLPENLNERLAKGQAIPLNNNGDIELIRKESTERESVTKGTSIIERKTMSEKFRILGVDIISFDAWIRYEYEPDVTCIDILDHNWLVTKKLVPGSTVTADVGEGWMTETSYGVITRVYGCADVQVTTELYGELVMGASYFEYWADKWGRCGLTENYYE